MNPDKPEERDAGAGPAAAAGRAADADAGGGRSATPADPALLAALACLAARTRELAEAVVQSEAPIGELRTAAAQIATVAARLGAGRRPGPIRPAADPPDRLRRHRHNPVTGEANPLAPPIQIATTPEGTARAEFIWPSEPTGRTREAANAGLRPIAPKPPLADDHVEGGVRGREARAPAAGPDAGEVEHPVAGAGARPGRAGRRGGSSAW